MSDTTSPQLPVVVASARSLMRATAIALAVAIFVLMTAVLPAEYGIDPLGAGKATGLLNMNAPTATPLATVAAAAGGPIAVQPKPYKVDAIEFSLLPMGSVEYKYHLDKGGTMIYSWTSTLPVNFDMHTEPDQGGAAASDSFESGQATTKKGTYTAPYAGIHGWYFQNLTDKDVKIVVQTAGFYDIARMFDESGSPTDFEVQDPPPPPTY